LNKRLRIDRKIRPTLQVEIWRVALGASWSEGLGCLKSKDRVKANLDSQSSYERHLMYGDNKISRSNWVSLCESCCRKGLDGLTQIGFSRNSKMFFKLLKTNFNEVIWGKWDNEESAPLHLIKKLLYERSRSKRSLNC
jgi:hypothetical protein